MVEIDLTKSKIPKSQYKSFEELAALPRRRSKMFLFLGPVFVAGVAYIDPGNFTTNITAGSRYGYLLLWVVIASNLMAILIQLLSATIGIATGKNIPEVSGELLLKPVTYAAYGSKAGRSSWLLT